MPAIQISYLADCAEYLPMVASWVFDEWGHEMDGMTQEGHTAEFRGHLNRDRIPLTIIALLDGQPAGTASIYDQDMEEIHPELSPWLAAVYVPPQYRDQGIGSELVKAIEEIAKKLQIRELYLFTPDKELFYTRLGWSVLEKTGYRGRLQVVMHKSLGG
ncbi:MAG: GNAT family N-acetyltransferase [Omnitrophica WOR_2 bacterium]